MLTVVSEDPTEDHDHRRLRYIPELKVLRLLSDRITDEGIKHVRDLECLENLEVYSSKVTAKCLNYIGHIEGLKRLDMQGARGVPPSAFVAVAAQLPALVHSFAPKP